MKNVHIFQKDVWDSKLNFGVGKDLKSIPKVPQINI